MVNLERGDKGMSAMRIFIVLVMFLVATGIFAGWQSAKARFRKDAPASVNVNIDNFSFGPATITVPVGTRITWINRDDIPHTVVSASGAFKSKVLDTNDKFSFTFSNAGTFEYYCSVHPKMTGKVVVQ
jgi:plastocyanin